MTHTPRPWLLTEDGRTVYATTPYEGEDKWHKGKLRFPEGVNRFSCQLQGGNKESAPPGEMKSNARLIAAAPDLLEALHDVITRAARIRDDGAVVVIEAAFIVQVAKAAVAKATGVVK